MSKINLEWWPSSFLCWGAAQLSCNDLDSVCWGLAAAPACKDWRNLCEPKWGVTHSLLLHEGRFLFFISFFSFFYSSPFIFTQVSVLCTLCIREKSSVSLVFKRHFFLKSDAVILLLFSLKWSFLNCARFCFNIEVGDYFTGPHHRGQCSDVLKNISGCCYQKSKNAILQQ